MIFLFSGRDKTVWELEGGQNFRQWSLQSFAVCIKLFLNSRQHVITWLLVSLTLYSHSLNLPPQVASSLSMTSVLLTTVHLSVPPKSCLRNFMVLSMVNSAAASATCATRTFPTATTPQKPWQPKMSVGQGFVYRLREKREHLYINAHVICPLPDYLLTEVHWEMTRQILARFNKGNIIPILILCL